VGSVNEQNLRTHRDQALKFLKENRAQSREGIELLVKEHLPALVAATRPTGSPTPQQVEALYREVLDLSFMVFSLGYTLANADSKQR
jgi:hypothetical protein